MKYEAQLQDDPTIQIVYWDTHQSWGQKLAKYRDLEV